MVSKTDLAKTPKISHKVRDYVWNYIYENLLKDKKVMTDEKSKYRITFDLEKFDADKHKFFPDSEFNTNEDKFLPEPKFNKQGDLKFTQIGVISTKLSDDMAARVYADLIYDAIGSFLVLISKKVTKEELDNLKKNLDYKEIEGFPYPASIEEAQLFTF